MFVSILLAAGWRVNALTPDPQNLIKRLQFKNQSDASNLNVLAWGVLRPSLFQCIQSRLRRIFGIAGIAHANKQSVENAPELDPRFLDPVDIARRVNASLKKCKWPPSFVFIMYMDMYPAEGARWQEFENINKLPWAGIRFVPSQAHTESYYCLASLKGMCFLDKEVCDQTNRFLPHKTFGYLPDITDRTLPATQSELFKEIKLNAAGRKIVFLGGTLGGNKNLSCWYQLIARADHDKFYFVQIGEMFEDTLTPEDLVELAKIKRSCPPNLYIKLKYLPDEARFNEVIQASDVIFAVYRNFKISSNMLGKAAAFSKPILVAADYLMGQRVRQYGIGLAVAEKDVDAMQVALNTLVNNTESLSTQFAAYRHDFSQEALGTQLIAFLKQCMAQS
jgi:glycosyltransferase involved in cell wall biosynthesis